MNSEVAFDCFGFAINGAAVPADTAFAPRFAAAEHDGHEWLALSFPSGFDGQGMAARGRVPLRLSLVLDISGSMGMRFDNDDMGAYQSKLDVAKASIKSIARQLSPQDQLSITLFNHSQQLMLPLQPVTDIAALETQLDQLGPSGGTRLAEGFKAGLSQLEQAPAAPGTVSRVVFLTDMQSSGGDEAEVLRLIREAAQSQGTQSQARQLPIWSTIFGIGVDLSIASVQQISSTPGGRYISVAQAEEFAAKLANEFLHDSIPVAFDVQVKLSDHIARVYGHPELAGLPSGSTTFTLSSEFANPDPSNTGIVLIKLQPLAGAQARARCAEVTWRTLDGSAHKQVTPIAETPVCDAIRKSVALVNYVELLDEYVMDDSVDTPTERMASATRWIGRFTKFQPAFVREVEKAGDTTLGSTNASFMQTLDQMVSTEQAELAKAQREQTMQAEMVQPLHGDEPKDFVCCITQALMSDPVIAADGHSYERRAIAEWLARKRVSPKTNLPLPTTALLPNHALKAAISAFLESRGPNRAQARNPRAGPSRVLASRHTGRAPSMESSKTSRHTPQKTARKHPRAATKMCTVTSQMQQSRRRADATPSPKQVRNPLINRYASRTRASSAWTRSGVKYSPAGNEARQA